MRPALMTWGQIRLNVLTTSPGVPLDLIDEWMNSRYSTLLEATDWIGLKAHAMIQTLAAYQSGADTVTVTVGSSAVTGVGTTWTTTAATGLQFYVPGDTAVYTIEIFSDTFLSLGRPYEGQSGIPIGTQYSASPYVLMQNIYPLPDDCRSVVTVMDPRTSLPLTPFTKDALDACAGMRATIGYPASWAEYDDTPEPSQQYPIAQPVVHQIEFFPPPQDALGFSLEYLRAANSFDGQTLNATPLPFISPTAILAGVRADVALFQEKLTQALGYEKQFQAELSKLLLVEHSQRRVKTAVKMAPRFTRHRLGRINRGQSVHGWANPGGPL
jgi:hypothetical protein